MRTSGSCANVGKMADPAFMNWQFRGTAREGATGMSSMVIRASCAAKDSPVVEATVVEATVVEATVGKQPWWKQP